MIIHIIVAIKSQQANFIIASNIFPAAPTEPEADFLSTVSAIYTIAMRVLIAQIPTPSLLNTLITNYIKI